MPHTIRYALIPIFSTTVFSYCLFTIISFIAQEAVVTYNFFIALLCALGSLIANYRFTLRDRSLAGVAVLNGALIAITEFIGFAAPNELEGFWVHVFAAACFAAPIVHGIVLSREPVKASTMLIYCELSIVGTIMLFALQIGTMTIPAFTNGLSVTALILNLFMLSILRITGPAKKAGSRRSAVERGAMLSAVLVCIVFASAFVAVFLLPASRNAVFFAAYAVRDFFIFAGEGLGRFFAFLFSLLPAPPESELPAVNIDTGDMGQIQGEAMRDMGADFGMRVFVVCAIVAAIIILAIVIRFRKVKLRGRRANVLFYETETGEKGWFFRTLAELPARLKAWLYFQKCRCLRKGTYEEAYLRIASRAKRRGINRSADETPQAFLYRIAAAFPPEPGAEERVRLFLGAVSSALDRRLYSAAQAEFIPISPQETETCKMLLSTIYKKDTPAKSLFFQHLA